MSFLKVFDHFLISIESFFVFYVVVVSCDASVGEDPLIASTEKIATFIPMTNHLIDVEEAEAECIRFAHALFLELNRPETSPEKLRSAPVNDARYRKKMCHRKNLGGM